MLNVHLVQETNTNTHTKNKTVLLAASSAMVGTLSRTSAIALTEYRTPQRTWPSIEIIEGGGIGSRKDHIGLWL